jgi:hypothetical protein
MLGDIWLLEKRDNRFTEGFGMRFPWINRWVHVQTSCCWSSVVILAFGCDTTIVWSRKSAVETNMFGRTIRVRNFWKSISLLEASQDCSDSWLVLR